MAAQELNPQEALDWLERGVAAASTPEALIAGLNQRLVAGGIALARVAVFVRTLHPNVAGRAFFWRAERPQTPTARWTSPSSPTCAARA